MLNAKIVEALKLTNNIDINITIYKGQQDDRFSSTSKNKNKIKNLELNSVSNNNLPSFMPTLFNQVINPKDIIN